MLAIKTHSSVGRQIRNLATSIKRLNQALEEDVQKLKDGLHDATISNDIKPMIGLEVHAQIDLKSKLFSQGANDCHAAPNSQLDLFDVSLPGTLPKLNKLAIQSAILTGLALNCNIQDVIHFDRKNYFYRDMPAGFQLTQYNKPIAKNGYIDFIVASYHKSVIAHTQQYDVVKYLFTEDRFKEDIVPYLKRSRITQLQLEQDSAKTMHQESARESSTLIDYNRSGAALMEIVFEPDLTSGAEAASLIRELILILKSTGTCNCELQDGSLRVDANVSIKSIGGREFNEEAAPRVELKNLNSLKSLDKGIAYEIQRQATILKSGDKVLRESRTFDSRTGKTVILRDKESAIDYRFVPEPSIPPFKIGENLIIEARNHLPEKLPSNVREKLLKKYNLDLAIIVEIIEEPGLDEYLCEILEGKQYDPNVVGDFLIYSIRNLKNIEGLPLEVDLTDKNGDFLKKLTPMKLQKLFDMMLHDEISFATAYEVMKCLYSSNECYEPENIIDGYGWRQINDEVQIEEYCKRLIEGMKNISKKYSRNGSKKYLRMMLAKLVELHKNQISIKKAIYCLNKLLRPHSTS